MNYAALVTMLEDMTENRETSFVAHIPDFFKQAENRIYNTVLFPALRKNVTGAFTQGNRFLSMPSDFNAVSDISYTDGSGNTQFLIPKDTSFIRQAYPNATTQDTPKYYAIFGPQSSDEKLLTLIIGPTPDSAYVTELHYFYYPASIVTAGNTWLGDHFDTVLLYGALVEAYIYMKGEQDVFMAYEMKFKEALAMAKRLGDGLEKSDIYRNGEQKE